jgi:methionine-S-sulfoxide reductase
LYDQAAAAVTSEKAKDRERIMQTSKLETATFAAGCFWGVQDLFDAQKGVGKTFVGYTGGHTKKPIYKDVCTDSTGHAEAVEVYYDPKVITYKQLLDVFFRLHDPTTVNRQGPDAGSQYRSVIFYRNEAQKKEALDFISELKKKKVFPEKIVTEVTVAKEFYKAEEYHQKYFKKTGQSGCHILRK